MSSLKLVEGNLHRAITLCAPATDKDGARPILAGVNLRTDGDRLLMGGADGFRLSQYTMDRLDDTECNVTLDRKTLQEVNKRLKNSGNYVDLDIDTEGVQPRAMLRAGNEAHRIPLLQGNYPPYNVVVDDHADWIYPCRASVDVDELIDALKVAVILGPNVRMFLRPGRMTFSIRSGATNGSIDDDRNNFDAMFSIPADTDDEHWTGINAQFMLDQVKAIRAAGGRQVRDLTITFPRSASEHGRMVDIGWADTRHRSLVMQVFLSRYDLRTLLDRLGRPFQPATDVVDEDNDAAAE